ncbi:MAG: hypothetical protein F6K36_16275 [Symploca sp. SIO3C6]|uniref:Cyanobacterial TRADD-N associated 2 transmembrane domain-containing protein n=1 Tax=Symploca sp. SIO1C4 TaxID=2607765 RepID=A0A6B3NKK6_9CYAN|nr:hypothetical protein [Symploca sp. SIO3C6]NER32107.1 hypothetical protein [Symploca sp. SIO1C4]NET05807.1 hypothetical protein [Symploca sp. SIO2B6]
MRFNFLKKPENNDNHSVIKKEIIRELLRQVRLSYNLAFAVTAASALITLSGVGLLYLDKVSEATLTTSGGVLATITSTQLAKQSKEELQGLMDELSDS